MVLTKAITNTVNCNVDSMSSCEAFKLRNSDRQFMEKWLTLTLNKLECFILRLDIPMQAALSAVAQWMKWAHAVWTFEKNDLLICQFSSHWNTVALPFYLWIYVCFILQSYHQPREMTHETSDAPKSQFSSSKSHPGSDSQSADTPSQSRKFVTFSDSVKTYQPPFTGSGSMIYISAGNRSSAPAAQIAPYGLQRSVTSHSSPSRLRHVTDYETYSPFIRSNVDGYQFCDRVNKLQVRVKIAFTLWNHVLDNILSADVRTVRIIDTLFSAVKRLDYWKKEKAERVHVNYSYLHMVGFLKRVF
jgi:hypothetical protein